jgi:hypothetical protein
MPGKVIRGLNQKRLSRPSRGHREATLLVPSLADSQAAVSALKQIVDSWVMPRLVDEYLRARKITPKSRFLPNPSIERS